MASPVCPKDELVFEHYRRYQDPEDLRILLERYRERLVLFLLGYLGNMEDAEEAMLDAFAAAAAEPERFAGASSFKTWLFAIGRNQAMRRIRKQKLWFRTLPVNEQAEDQAVSPEISVLKEERNRELYLALEQLNEDYRQALFLIYFEGMDHSEAALVMKKNVKQIYNLVHRGRQALKEKLKEMGFEHEKFG